MLRTYNPIERQTHYPEKRWLRLFGQLPKILGGLAGGLLAGRKAKAKDLAAQKADTSAM
jgi:hypothetical protein